MPPKEDLWQRLPEGRYAIDPAGGAIDEVLVWLHTRAPWSVGRLDPARPTECLFTIESAVNPEGQHIEASLRADATTLLPTSLTWVETNDTTGSVSTFERTMDVTGDAPIEPPADDEVAPPGTPAP